MDYIKSDKYLVSSDGQIRFTEQGLRDLGDYFSRAGISIHTIKTYKEYREARALAAPYFMDYLDDRVRQMPDHGEYALLKSLTFDPPEVYEEKLRKHALKKAMSIVK